MQALPMIAMGAKAPETVAQAQPAELASEGFGQVLATEQTTAGSEQEQLLEFQQETVAEVEAGAQLSDLPMAGLVKAEVPLDETVDQLESELSQLASDQQLLAGAAAGEPKQVLAVTTAELLPEAESKEPLAQAEIEVEGLMQQTEVEDGELGRQLPEAAAAAEPSVAQSQPALAAGEQLQADPAMEPVLRSGLVPSSVAGQEPKPASRQHAAGGPILNQVVSIETQTATEGGEGPPVAEAEEVDPRFAGLLQPRAEKVVSLRPERSLPQTQQPTATLPTEATLSTEATLTTDAGQQQSSAAEWTAETANLAEPRVGGEPLPPQAAINLARLQGGQEAGPVKQVAGEARLVQLPSGELLPESQLLDQVVTQIQGSRNGESGRMVLRLHPAELGSLRLELVVEGDRVRAQLQAQTLQVQEVLERNLPLLRESLAQQGLRIDQFKVDINPEQGRSGYQEFAQDRSGTDARQPDRPWQQQAGWRQEEIAIPLEQLLHAGAGGGISLRV